MSKSISESGQRSQGTYQAATISKKQLIITTIVALAAITALVIGLMAILSPNNGSIPLSLRGGIACVVASGITLIILIALNCILCRKEYSSSTTSEELTSTTSTPNAKKEPSKETNWIKNFFKQKQKSN